MAQTSPMAREATMHRGRREEPGEARSRRLVPCSNPPPENAWVVQGEQTWSPKQLKWPIQLPPTLRPPMDRGPHLRYRCPCQRPGWEAPLAGTGEPWRIMDTADLRFRYTGRPLDLLSVSDKDKANLSRGARSRYMPITPHTMAAFLSSVEVIKAMNRRMGS